MTKVAQRDSIVWTDDFLIGIEELDFEHRMLIRDINLLHKKFLENDGRDSVNRVLGDIHARMQAHFALEEHFMRENKYPYYLAHKKEHDELLDEYTDFMIHFDGKDGEPDYRQAEEVLSRWIIDHIFKNDKKMSDMIEQWRS